MKKIVNAIKKFAMEKKKAFTLIELMGVLVIVGILTVILIPVINNTIKNKKQDLYNQQIELIKLSAKNLASDNEYILPEEVGDEIFITLGQLRAMGYAEETIINPLTKENFSDDLIVMVIKRESDYDYEIIIDGGTVVASSGIIVSNPSKKYIRKSNTSAYIITAKSEKELDGNKTEYYINLGKENINILGNASEDDNVKYKILGNGGLYKLIIVGGEKEGYLYFNFKEVKDIDGKEVKVSEINSEINSVKNNKQIIVDNTAPVINFTINGTNTWAKSVKTRIEVTDNNGNDALDTDTYKYIYSLAGSVNQELTNSYNLANDVTQENGDGEYYLIAKACDKAGNCETKRSNKFLVDNTAPKCNWSGENDTWTNKEVAITLTGTDEHEMNSSKESYTKTYNQSDIVITNKELQYEIEDEAGNKTECKKFVNVYYDTKAPSKPVITLTKDDINGPSYDQGWTNSNIWTKATSKDEGSGINEYYIGHDANANSYAFSSLTWTKSINDAKTEIKYLIDWEGSWDFYVKSCDKAGNCNTSDKFGLHIDKTKPWIDADESCTPAAGYNKCHQFTFKDNVANTLTVYRAHCGNYNTQNDSQICGFASAKTRVETFKNTGNLYSSGGLTDNKATTTTFFVPQGTFTGTLPLNTSFKSGTIQYAFIVCDEAGNCSNTYEYTK